MTKTILVAEDDSFFGETIKITLEEHGVKVLLVKNGEEAIEVIGRKAPDLLLLDLLMPKKDGFAVLSHLKEHNIRLPVVILSNFSDHINDEKCVTLGVKDYFIKSDMDEDELWPRIKRYL